VLFITVPTITSINPFERGTSFLSISWTVNNPLELQSNGTIFTLSRSNSNEEFISGLITSGSAHQCFSDLQPDTLYTVEIVAVYACDNATMSGVFRTEPGSVNNVSLPDECLEYRPSCMFWYKLLFYLHI